MLISDSRIRRMGFVLCALAPACAVLADPPANLSYRLVFAEEFNGKSLDTNKWSEASPGWTMPNSASTASAGQVDVSNGVLTMNAVRTSSTAFTSGSISSYQKYTFTSGYVEARINLPSTPGSWPAFWGLYTGWPPEMDIMEYPLTTDGGANGYFNNEYHTAFHYVNGSGGNSAGAGKVTTGTNLSNTGYHTFAADWTDDTSVRFYLDGNQVHSFTNSAVAQMQYMYMILDYAVGGWPGTPTTTQWPVGFSDQTLVDWVRVWQTNPNNDAASTWNINGSGAFSTSGNWAGAGVPKYGNQPVEFGRVGNASAAVVSMGNWQVMGSITFSGDGTGTTAYTLGSSSNLVQLSSTAGPSITAESSSTVNQTIAAKVELQGNTVIRNQMTGTQLITLSGGVTGPGKLTVDGAGTVVLSGAGSYLGGTEIGVNQGPGVLRAGATGALGTGTVSIGPAGNSTTARLEISGASKHNNNIDFNGRNNSSVGIQNISGNNSIAGTIALDPGGSNDYRIQSNSGTLTLTGLSPNATARGVAIQSNASGARIVTLQGAGNGVVSGTIRDGNGNISLVKEGAGTWTLSGANSYSGTTTINGGILRLSATSSVALPTPLARYNFNNISGTTVINDGSGGSAMNGTLNPNGGTGTINVTGGPTTALGALQLNGNGTTVDINSGITSLNGTGTWTVSMWVKTTQPGMTLLNKGDGTNWSSGNSTFYLGDGTDDGIGGVPDAVRWGGGFLAGSTPVNDGNWHLVTYTNSSGTKSIYVDGTLEALSQNQFTTNDVGAMVRLGFSPNSEVDGNVRPNGSLSGVNFYSVALTSNQIASIYNGTFASAGSPLPTTGNVTIGAGGTLDVNGVAQTIGSLTGAAGSAITLGTGALTVNSSASTTFAGAVSGIGSFTKANSGSLTLSGINTYTGTTTVSGGTLRIAGTHNQNASYIVAGTSVLDVTGTLTAGTVANAGTFASAGTSTVSAITGTGTTNITGGTLTSNGAIQQNTVAVSNGATARVSANGAILSKVGTLNVNSTGTLDLNDNDVVVVAGAGTYASVNAKLGQGYNSGDWSGTGIRSTSAAGAGNTALGILTGQQFLDNDTLGAGTFSGHTVAANDLLVKYTYQGDNNLDGAVDDADLFLFLPNYTGSQVGDWLAGDYTYDGAIDDADLFLFLPNYTGGASGLSAAMSTLGIEPTPAILAAESSGLIGSALVPEPATLSLLALGAGSLLRRRQNRPRRTS